MFVKWYVNIIGEGQMFLLYQINVGILYVFDMFEWCLRGIIDDIFFNISLMSFATFLSDIYLMILKCLFQGYNIFRTSV